MKKIWLLLLLFVFILQFNQLSAVKPVNTTETEVILEAEELSTKELKKQEKLLKKMQKLERKIEKRIEKKEMQKKRSILQEPMFRLGLICILGGILLGILAGSTSILGVLGGLLGVIGIVLLILGLLNY